MSCRALESMQQSVITIRQQAHLHEGVQAAGGQPVPPLIKGLPHVVQGPVQHAGQVLQVALRRAPAIPQAACSKACWLSLLWRLCTCGMMRPQRAGSFALLTTLRLPLLAATLDAC